ncbi:hypothetical protein M7963_22990, partial [Enterobacter roggenkampii]|nr:hypothetical protein [Enterobacter roggenkampii]
KAPEAENLQLTVKAPEAENTPPEVKAPEAENTQLAVKAPEAENLQLTVKAPEAENTPPEVKTPEAENTQLSVKAPEAENFQLTVKAPEAENAPPTVKAPEAENTQLSVKAPEAENLQLTVKAPEAENTPPAVSKPIEDVTTVKVNAPIEEYTSAEGRNSVAKSAIIEKDKLKDSGLDISKHNDKSEKYAYALGYYYASLLEKDLSKMKAVGVEFVTKSILQGFSGGLNKELFLSEEELTSLQEELNDEFIMKSKPLFRQSKKTLAQIAKDKSARKLNEDEFIVVKKRGTEAKATAIYHFEITMNKIESPEKTHYDKKIAKDDVANYEMLQEALKYSGIGGELDYYTLGKNVDTEFLLKEVNPWDVIVYNIKIRTL